MAYPVYVLLPVDVEFAPVLPGTDVQAARPVRWYLRQSMPEATTQTVVLVRGEGDEREARIAAVVRRCHELGGVAVDGTTQDVIEAGALEARSTR